MVGGGKLRQIFGLISHQFCYEMFAVVLLILCAIICSSFSSFIMVIKDLNNGVVIFKEMPGFEAQTVSYCREMKRKCKFDSTVSKILCYTCSAGE